MCGKQFRQKKGLVLHERSHTGEKPFLCSQCGKGFISSDKLKRHLLSHTTEKRLMCDLCGFKTNYRQDLKTHVCTGQTDNNRGTCRTCGKLLSKVSLELHRKIHEAEQILNESEENADVIEVQ